MEFKVRAVFHGTVELVIEAGTSDEATERAEAVLSRGIRIDLDSVQVDSIQPVSRADR